MPPGGVIQYLKMNRGSECGGDEKGCAIVRVVVYRMRLLRSPITSVVCWARKVCWAVRYKAPVDSPMGAPHSYPSLLFTHEIDLQLPSLSIDQTPTVFWCIPTSPDAHIPLKTHFIKGNYISQSTGYSIAVVPLTKISQAFFTLNNSY